MTSSNWVMKDFPVKILKLYTNREHTYSHNILSPFSLSCPHDRWLLYQNFYCLKQKLSDGSSEQYSKYLLITIFSHDYKNHYLFHYNLYPIFSAQKSPLILHVNWMSFGIMVTHFAWMAHIFALPRRLPLLLVVLWLLYSATLVPLSFSVLFL